MLIQMNDAQRIGNSPNIENADFFEKPILNSPYASPAKHWELKDGQPTQHIINSRRKAEFITPIPQNRKRRAQETTTQSQMLLDEGAGISTTSQNYDLTSQINEIRATVDLWRKLPKSAWRVTPVTARLLEHWRSHEFSNQRPFFCQIEAAETLIWLTEVAPHDSNGEKILSRIKSANLEANPELFRIALKLATGAGKTTVMAMIIAWQTLNAVCAPASKLFTKGFLVCAPGLTIRDRLRVLLPNDPDSYYAARELVPVDMLNEMQAAQVVITNYHAFKLRERFSLSAGAKRLLKGRVRGNSEPQTLETEGQMLRRVMPELLAIKKILIINDEAHHCYREKPDAAANKLSAEDKKDVAERNEMARLWISGLEAVQRKLGKCRVIDLSATPFFLRGSGYAEGSLFPWTVSDFSLFDAIECGIVKLPRVPVAQNSTNEDTIVYRNLWEHIAKDMPKKSRGKMGGDLDPAALPLKLQSAIDALYGQYEATFKRWRTAGMRVPPCFIFVCNNTATSKLIYDYISGYYRGDKFKNGHCELFQNYDAAGTALASPRTLLIDSQQLESGEELSKDFRNVASEEIKRFQRELAERTGDAQAGEKITDSDLLREVMNTVGKPGTLGEQIRCVVSVSMLTEGWDANNVTHILGVRAFGTQLLCEQVVGRALRRYSYALNDDGLFDVEYADVFGIPFDFTTKAVKVTRPATPQEKIVVKAISPDRDASEITFPRVSGYRIELPDEKISAKFSEDSKFLLTPEIVGPTETVIAGICGEEETVTLENLRTVRRNTIVYSLTQRLIERRFRDKWMLFGQLRKIVEQWMNECLQCLQNTFEAQICYSKLADIACERIARAITRAAADDRNAKKAISALLDPYNPAGSTRHVHFQIAKPQEDEHRSLYKTDSRKCHVNFAVCDSDWEAEFCRILEASPHVTAYVKNCNMGFEVPYRIGAESHVYIPDFIVRIARGNRTPLNLIVEIKGYRGENAKEKKDTMDSCWIPAVNALGDFGEWRHAEFTEIFTLKENFEKLLGEILSAESQHEHAPTR